MSFSRWLRGRVAISPGIGDQLRRFLGVWGKGSIHRWNQELPVFHLADLCRAFTEFFQQRGMTVGVRGTGGLNFPLFVPRLDALINAGPFAGFGTIGKTFLPTGPDKEEAFVTEAAFLVSGGAFPLVFYIQREDIPPQLILQGAIPADEGAIEWAAELTEELDEWIRLTSILRGQLLRPAIRPGEPCRVDFLQTPEDEIFEPSPRMVEQLEESFIDFLVHQDALAEGGIEGPRGLLLCGPPGTGKTSSCRWLKRRLPGHTMITVGSDGLPCLKDCFELARRLAPAILVIEDVDTLPQLRDPAQGNQVLAELMNQMDGLAARDDVSVVLTSNSWEFLEKAITERPGRVDQILLFEAPAREHRRALLERFTEKLACEAALDKLVELTDGLTPAQIKEFVKRAAVASLRRAAAGGWERRVSDADFERAIHGMKSGAIARAHRPIGLRPVELSARRAL